MLNNIEVKIPDDVWEDSSESGQAGLAEMKGSRLHATLHINGVLFHCEAIEVTTGDTADQIFEAVNPAWSDSLNEYYIACGAEGPMNPVTIAGREYAVFITPSCC